MRHYLFFATLSYAYPILRPLEEEIRRRGDDVAWYLEDTCPCDLRPDERQLKSFDEVRDYNPVAVFAPGNYIYDFFPGVKVSVFHGYPIYKRGGTEETHFRIRGWFDIYLSFGPSSTPVFKKIESEKGTFKVYETGWLKADAMVQAREKARATAADGRKKTVFVATTFTARITQLAHLYPTICRLADTHDWNWVITMHPKLDDPQLRANLRRLADTHGNVTFLPDPPSPDAMAQTDVMLCDASSIILEYMMLDKPVVTLRNTTPGAHLLNVESEEDVEEALETAMNRPPQLMEEIRKYLDFHEAHRDGHNSARVLDAVDDFVTHYQGRIRRKPLNLFRRLKLRWKLRYFRW